MDVWFQQGYKWNGNYQDSRQERFKNYYYEAFRDGCRQLALKDKIYFYGMNGYKGKTVEYKDFMAQQKEDKETSTVYVTKEQLDWINNIKEYPYKLTALASDLNVRRDFSSIEFDDIDEKDILRYLGGDETVEFKVKEPLYRLWRMETNDRIYMRINDFGTPIWTVHKDNAFTAPLEKIKKWQTPAWSVEEVK